MRATDLELNQLKCMKNYLEFAEVKDIVMNNVDEHLRFAKPIFEQIDSLQQIIDLPEHK